jgi:RHH-type rel operon transcriptional repressor/antitoxin RelB
MLTLEVELPKKREDELVEMSRSNGSGLNEIAREALLNYLEDREDYRLAHERASKGGPRFSLEEVRRELGLED